MKIANRYLDRIRSNFERHGDRVFCRLIGNDGEKLLSWRDFERDCGRFAAAYRAAGLKPGDVVLIFLKHVPELYGSFFGAALGGFTPSFMPCASPRQDPTIYWSSHRELVRHIRPAAIVASRDVFSEMAASGLDLGDARSIVIEDVADAVPEFADNVAEDAIGLLQHSSGTTGLKKGVALSFTAILEQLDSYGRAISLTDDDVIVSWLPLYHDMGLIACCILPTYFGIPVVHIDPFYWTSRPDLLFRAIGEHGGTLVWQPNFAFEHLANVARGRAAEFKLAGVRAFINCSEPCKPLSFDRFAQAFAPAGVRQEQLHCCYAMAETVFAVSQTPLGKAPARLRVMPESLERGQKPMPIANGAGGIELISTGTIIDGIEAATFDEQGRPLPEGHVGEIGLRGRFLFSGYNKDPERTADRLRDGRYFTRDVGFIDGGQVYVLGRIDDMIIINGRNLYAHEVEAAISGISGLKPGRSVAASLFDDKVGSDTLIIIAEKDTGVPRPNSQIQRDILNVVNSTFNVQPRKVQVVDPGWLVKTTSGKISRKDNVRKLMGAAQERVS